VQGCSASTSNSLIKIKEKTIVDAGKQQILVYFLEEAKEHLEACGLASGSA